MLGAMSYSIFQNQSFIAQSPFQKSLPFANLLKVTADSQGQLYMITQSKESIIKLNSSGTLQYKINLNREADGSLNNFNDLAIDSKGYLYALQTGLDSFGLYVNTEQIVRYKPDGTFDKVLYSLNYGGNSTLLRVGKIRSLQMRDDSLYFFIVENNKIQLDKLSENEKEPKTIFNTTIIDNVYLSEITGTVPGEIYFSTKRGKIYRMDAQGNQTILYPLNNIPSGMKSVPVSILLDNKHNLYFINPDNNEINRISLAEPFKLETVFKKSPTDLDTEDLSSITNLADGKFIVSTSDHISKMDVNGRISTDSSQTDYSNHWMFMCWFVWTQIILSALLLLWLLHIIYAHLMQRRVSLLLKQIIVFVPLIIVSMILLSLLIYSNYSKELADSVASDLKLLSHNGQNLIDGDKLEKINSANDFMSDDYKAIKLKKNALFIGKSGHDRDGLYSTIYKIENNQIYVIMDDDDSVKMFQKYSASDDNAKVLKDGSIIDGENRDETGFWKYAIGPIYNSQEKIVGIYEVGRDMNAFERHKQELLMKIVEGILAITLVIIIVFLLLSYYLLSSIRTLRKSVIEIAGGNWNTVVSIQSRDEVADLGDNFNHMAQSIQMYIANITKLNEANNRFVPRQFLQYLGKESIQNVQLGDQVEQEMGILILNMQAFYDFSKDLTPKENFNFINSFLSRFGPVVRKNEGMINKYLGAGIMALFPNRAEDTLNTAIEMRQELEVYNIHRLNSGYDLIDISVGIHRGPLMLGIIGEEKRMEGNVISDNVNIASILEKMANSLGASILITDNIYNKIENPLQYECRSLGMVYVEGKDQPIHLYDVFQGDPEHVRKLKAKTKQIFENAIDSYQNGRFYNARESFLEVIKQNRWDKAARLYFYMTDEFYQNGATEDWNGALNVS